jgi:hypothetical protein
MYKSFRVLRVGQKIGYVQGKFLDIGVHFKINI